MSQFKSLLGLNELAVDSLNILNLDLTNTNIVGLNTDRVPEDADPVNLYYTDGRFDTRLASKSTSDVKEGSRLYYTEQRVRDNDEVKASTQHRSNTSNPHQTSLYNLIDTNILAQAVGQYLTYNDVDGKWRNTYLGSIDTLSDVVITTPIAANSYLTYNSINWVNKTFPINVDGSGNISMLGTLNITGVNLLNTKDVDTWINEHEANNDKVSADGSINTHSDVLITGTPADNQLLIYSTGQWQNVAPPFLRLDGSVNMAGALNMGGFAISGASTYNGITLSNLAADSTVVKLTGDQTIAGTKTFSDKITIALDKPLIMGRTTRGLAAYTGGLELYGTSGVAGPHMQAFTTANPNYPCFQLINNGHSNLALKFDCYWDGAVNDKSSFLTSNFMISKGTNLLFQYAAGVAVGSNITWNTAMDINSTSGLLTTKAITASGAITANAGISVVNNTADIRGEARTGTHATPVGLYVSANLGQSSAGIEFRHSNGTQGVGFGYNSIYATGSSTNVELNLYSKGSSLIYARNALTASAGISTTTLTTSGLLTANDGCKLSIQNKVDGGNGQGIFMWDTDNTEWGMYLATGGGVNTKSLAGGSAVSGNDFNFGFRFRAFNNSGYGFIWENSSEQLLMSLRGNDGTLWTKGLITASAGVSTTTLTASGRVSNLTAGATCSLSIQGGNDGTSNYGLWLWNYLDYNYSFYMASSGASKAFGNGTACAGNDFTGRAIRMRIYPDATQGFIWETSSEILLMSLNGLNGTLWTKGNISINGALAATQSYVDTKDGQNVKLTGDQTITGIKIFNGTRNDIRALNLLSQADFNNVDIINGGNITYNGARILNQNGGDAFFSQTTGDWQSFLYTLNTDTSGTADQRGYVFTNVAFDAKGAGLYISKLTDAKFMSSDIVRFNNAGGMRFYGALDMNSNNITNGGTITGTTITSTAGMTTTTLTASDNIVVGAGKKIFVDRSANANNKLVLYDNGTGSTTAFFGFGITSSTLLYNVSPGCNHVFYINGSTELFRINETTITASKSITANSGISTTTLATTDKITTSNGVPIIVGRTTKSGVSGGLELYGNVNASAGPHIQCVSSEDNHPSFQVLPWSHGNVNLVFDAYYNGSSWISSSSGSNFSIAKTNTLLTFYYKSGVAAGSSVAWSTGPYLDTSGFFNIPTTAINGVITLGTRSGYTSEPMILLRSGNSANNRGFFGFSGTNVYAWCTSTASGEPSGTYNYIAVGGAWGNSSDRRLKADIKTLECGDCCEKLMKLNCCSYYLKSDEKKEKKNCGFIADEVKKIFPEFVDTTDMKIGEDENIEGITYTSFIPILVSAFQHMAEKVINLEKENKTLLNILQDQANQLAEIRAVVFPPNVP